MAAVPLQEKPVHKDEVVRERFERLAADWERAVAHHSSESIRTQHPAYREIISLGPAVIPLLFRDMESHQRHWFAALSALTGASPVASADAGRIPSMIEAWLKWGRDNGFQW